MTKIYFVRHAEPIHSWKDDRTRPLSPVGVKDSEEVTAFFKDIAIDVFISSPYKRSMDTISGSAVQLSMQIITDERLRERQSGVGIHNHEMIRRRWADFDFCEQDGETLRSTQKRNMEAVFEIISMYQDKCVVVGTHGTALSTILNYYNSAYNYDSFIRIIDYMPYIIRLDFSGV